MKLIKKSSKIWKFVEAFFVEVHFVGNVFIEVLFVVSIISSHLIAESSKNLLNIYHFRYYM